MSDGAASGKLAGRLCGRLAQHAGYFIANAPWTLASSLGGGLATYVVMILLTQYHGLEAVGQFRLLISIVAMMSLATLLDSGKILIKQLVKGERGVVRPLLLHRMAWSLIGVAGGLVTAGMFYQRVNELAPAIAAVALILPVLLPTNLYVQINQSQRQFRQNALINIAQYGTIVVLATACMLLQWNLLAYFVCFFLTTALFNSWFMFRAPEVYEPVAPSSGKIVRDARHLSVSGLLQVILEHADKFLITYFLGLEALGLYAIGVSTGRLLLHFVKPLLVIYLPELVEKRFSLNMQVLSFSLLTVVGVLLTLVLPQYMALSFGEDRVGAYPIAAVIVLGMGMHFVGVTKYYSSVFYKGASLRIPVLTNLITVPLIVVFLIAVLRAGGEHVLILCALSYPLRELANIVVISSLNAFLRVEVAGPIDPDAAVPLVR